MSHQTGIHGNEDLKKFFGRCRDGKIRAIKVVINKEKLALAKSVEDHRENAWDKSYDKIVIPLVEENQPCYILYRLDTKNDMGYEWVFISWSPDTSPVREKMLYASTKATLKQEFGTAQIISEIHGTILSDVTLEGYNKYKRAEVTPAPLTVREEELRELKRNEVHTDYSVTTKYQTLTGVCFPITDAAKRAVLDMISGAFDYAQFKIDMEEEKIDVVSTEHLTIEKLPLKIPQDAARYHLFKFKHTHEGDYMESIVFIYSMPGYNCSIKERMLYSSCKNPLTDIINNLGLEITKKLEIDSGLELTQEYLYEEIHPTKNLYRPKFAKPKGPPGRGPKRMTRTQENTV